MTGFNKILGSIGKKDKSKRNSFSFSDRYSNESDNVTSRTNSHDNDLIPSANLQDNNVISQNLQNDNVISQENFQDDMYSEIDVLYETKDNFKKTSTKCKNNVFVCEMCSESNDNPFIILNCNHIYHIICLANEQIEYSKQCQIIDNDTFFNKMKCNCGELLESSEIMMIQNKFYKNTDYYIQTHDIKINKLDDQINLLKEQMKTCIEYKQKLEFEKQKSKQIITLLNTMPM